MSQKNVQVNLTHSFLSEIPNKVPINEAINSPLFQHSLNEELFKSNTVLVDSPPSFVPSTLNTESSSSDLESVNYSVKPDENGLEKFITMSMQLKHSNIRLNDDISNQIAKIVSENVRKETTELRDKLESVLICSHYPNILRQMICELKEKAIEDDLKVNFDEIDDFEDYNRVYKENCKKMYSTYKNSESNHYYKILFTYPLDRFNICLHKRLNLKDEDQLKSAVEYEQGSVIDNNKLMILFDKWKIIKNKK